MSACLTMSTDRLETNCRDHFVEKKNVINGLHGCVADVRSWLQQLGLADRKCLWLYLPFVIFVSINHSFLTGRSLPPMSTAPLNYRNCHCTATPLMTESSSTINRRYRVQLVRLFGPSLIWFHKSYCCERVSEFGSDTVSTVHSVQVVSHVKQQRAFRTV